MQIEKREIAQGAAVLRLEGRLNMVAASRVRSAIEEAVDGGRPRVVVDLTEVTFMDSSGLGALIAGLKRARQASGDLRITGVSPQVATVLQLTNLDRVLRAHPSIDAAIDDW
ncbi:MAG: anti-anti-sigma factor [Nocardioides sp.]|nr:anti-anti-sigma factor [Nocardioides sp.]